MDEQQQHPERRSFVRFPITLFVDAIQFDPDVYMGDIVRTAYDLDIEEYDAKKLYEELGRHLKGEVKSPIRIRVIGRLKGS